MKKDLLSRLKIQYLDTLHRKERTRPHLVKNIFDVLNNNNYVGDLKISEVMDIINMAESPVNDYNYIWEMFNEN